MTERSQGQPGADRAVGRPGPAARMESMENGHGASGTTVTATRPEVSGQAEPEVAANGSNPGTSPGTKQDRPRTSVLISPVSSGSTASAPTRTAAQPDTSAGREPVHGSGKSPSGEPATSAPGSHATPGAGKAAPDARSGSRPKSGAVAITPVAKKSPQGPGGKAARPSSATSPAAPAGSPAKSGGSSAKSGGSSSAAAAPDQGARRGSKAPSGGSASAAAGAATAASAVSGAARGAAAKVRKSQAGRLAKTAVQGRASARSARLYLTHIDPWSVMKQAFLLSLVLAVVTLTAFAAIWLALDSAGVLDAITRTATDVGGESGANVTSFLDFSKVMGVALIISGIEAVLVTALATLFAFLYNLAVAIGGGVELTLSEDG
jgi:Transmembrane domain of unknown function (DUF3566)